MAGLNVAVACAFVTRVRLHVVLLPLHAPPHPAKVLKVVGAPGVSVSVTWVPELKLVLQMPGHLIPGGLVVTVPMPVPDKVTVNLNLGSAVFLKVAETEALAFNVTAHEPVPLHAPPHPVKLELVAGLAVKVTWLPVVKFALQAVPQSIPEGLLVIVPVPSPPGWTSN